jgi:hypothetical protein
MSKKHSSHASQKGKGEPESNKTATNPSVAIAWIGVITLIITSFFAFKPFEKWVDSHLNPSITPTVTITDAPAPTLTFTEPSPPIATDTLTPIPLSTQTLSSVATATVDPSATLRVTLVYSVSRDIGRVPLLVTINANNSTFMLGNGSVNLCDVTKSCVFTFRVSHDGEQLIEPLVTKDGKFSYTFKERGTYFVSIVVCRSSVCEADQVTITAN